ncbi:MAG: hypothetical protein WDZ49_08705 [Litorilinea sp.]
MRDDAEGRPITNPAQAGISLNTVTLTDLAHTGHARGVSVPWVPNSEPRSNTPA